MSRSLLRRSAASSLAKSSYSRRLRAEALEDRLMLAITVDTSSDVVDANDSVTSLREAIVSATAGDTIDFDAAVFTGGLSNLIRLTEGELEITDTLTIDGTSVGGVTITGDANGDDTTIPGTSLTEVTAGFGGVADARLDDNSRVLNFSAATGDLTLQSLTITGGRTTGDNSDTSDTKNNGGGIRFLSEGTLLLTDSTLSGNSTAGNFAQGGGLFSDGEVRLVSSTLSGNSTRGYDAVGGGIAASSVRLDSSTLSGNSTNGDGARGGGIYTRSGDVTVTNSVVSGNSTTERIAFGGGIFTRSGSVVLTNSTLSNNSTAGYRSLGGGICTFSGHITLRNSTVSANSTSGWDGRGGGLFTYSSLITLTNSTLSNNSTTGSTSSGGGMWFDDSIVLIENSTVTGNVTVGMGGGLSMLADSPDRLLTIRNSIIAGNSDNGTAPDFERPDNPETNLIVEHSLIGDNTGTGLGASSTADASGNLIGSPEAPLDPRLGPLANNGGPTLTHALLADSPAIDLGDSSFHSDATTPSRFDDQRGPLYARIVGGRIDIGSFESQPLPTFVRGDYNGDNVVNAADYTVWRDSLGTTGLSPLTGADGDGDGAVTATDYSIWRSHFGFEFPEGPPPNAGLSQTPNTWRSSKQVEESPSETAFASLSSVQAKNTVVATRRAFATPLRVALPENLEPTDDLLLLAVSQTKQQAEEVPAETVVNPELQIAWSEADTSLPPARPEWLPNTRGLAAF